MASPVVSAPRTDPVVVDGPDALVPVATGVRRRRLTVPRWVRRLASPIAILVLWQIASTVGWVDDRTLPPPTDVLRAGIDLWSDGLLQHHLWASLQRVGYGLALGVGVGTALAVLAGLFRVGEDLIDAPVQMLRTLPPLALVPLFILWFGIDEQPKIYLIALASLFPVYINLYAGIRNVDARLVEAARAAGLNRLQLIRHVVLPGALPSFFVGLRFSIGVAWLVLVVTEQVNATAGVGYMMNQAREFFRTEVIVLGLVIYGLLGLLSDVLVRALERYGLRWRRAFQGT